MNEFYNVGEGTQGLIGSKQAHMRQKMTRLRRSERKEEIVVKPSDKRQKKKIQKHRQHFPLFITLRTEQPLGFINIECLPFSNGFQQHSLSDFAGWV